MDILAETYLKYSPKPIEDLIGKEKKSKCAWCRIRVKEYATEDADITFQLKNYLPLSSKQTKHKAFCEIGFR
jgi:DNA polymerase-1